MRCIFSAWMIIARVQASPGSIVQALPSYSNESRPNFVCKALWSTGTTKRKTYAAIGWGIRNLERTMRTYNTQLAAGFCCKVQIACRQDATSRRSSVAAAESSGEAASERVASRLGLSFQSSGSRKLSRFWVWLPPARRGGV